MSQTPGTTPPSPPNPAPDAACGPYLWDRSLPVDAEVERLEKALEPLRGRGEFVGVEKVVRVRRMVVISRLAVAAVFVLMGTAYWWAWPSTPRIKQIGPWEVVSAPGARIEQVASASWNYGAPMIRITATTTDAVELRTRFGSSVRIGSGTKALVDDRGNIEIGAASERGGELQLAWAKGEPDWIGIDGHYTCRQGTTIVVDDEKLAIKEGEVRCVFSVSKSESVAQRAMGGMQLPRSAPVSVPVSNRASERFSSSLQDFDRARWRKDDSKMRMSTLESLLGEAHGDDVVTLWNLAFAGTRSIFEKNPLPKSELLPEEQERVVGRMGDLLGRWPAAIKSSKEPFWSQTFAEDWWAIIRESAAANPGKDGESNAARHAEDAEAMKKKDEAEKRAGENLKQQEVEKVKGAEDGGKKVSPPPTPPPDPKRRK